MNSIILDNKRVHDYIVDKDKLVEEGRSISRQIEVLEIKTKRCEEKEKRITGKAIPPKELTDRGDEIAKQMMSLEKEINKIIEEINKTKLGAVPKEMKDEHMKLIKDKEVLERDRNKVALKVQKIKDKLIPIVQREVRPLLKDKYDDVETAKAKDGKVVITCFNHLVEWKKKWE